MVDINHLHNLTGIAYYDSVLPTNEKFSNSYDVYVASLDTVFSAVLMSKQTYLVTINFNANSVVYKKALAPLQLNEMKLTRI